MPLPTSGRLRRSVMHGSCHEAADAGCSWRKRAPRSNCERYSCVMNSRCVLAVLMRRATSC
eukprot:13747045-Alexandrium_andersonii.AAC.1